MQVDGDGGLMRRTRRNEESANGGEDFDGSLKPAPRSKSLHDTFPLSQSMGEFSARLFSPLRDRSGHELATRGGVGAELVGDHAPRLAPLFAPQAAEKTFGRCRISMDLNDFVENVAVLIDGAPQAALLPGDRNDDFVEMPDIEATGLLTLQASRMVWAEPGPNFIAHRGMVSEEPTIPKSMDASLGAHTLNPTPNQYGSPLNPSAPPWIGIATN
jgi:hypothetical protein